ncbi:MAG: diguanylate cyclase [Bacillota bacterium]|nr:diguanylate cyclase [Bacillota bacterium]
MKALVADDSATVRVVLRTSLSQWGFEVALARDGNEAWDVLQGENPPSIAVLDLVMPGVDGLELCRRIRSRLKGNYIYVIILTARNNKEALVAGFEAGADDYIKKPFDLEELRYRLQSGRRVIELEREVRRLAATDFLTGLLNRRFFMDRLETEINRAARENINLSLVITDIDHFKRVNDTWGHQAGDLVLREFAACLTSLCRPYDFTGRYGGEEFIICLPRTDCDQAAAVAERMRAGIERLSVPLAAGACVSVTSSFGVASLAGPEAQDIDSLINQADKALYRAKAEGRNRVCVLTRGLT